MGPGKRWKSWIRNALGNLQAPAKRQGCLILIELRYGRAFPGGQHKREIAALVLLRVPERVAIYIHSENISNRSSAFR